jgi:hypothetical protein
MSWVAIGVGVASVAAGAIAKSQASDNASQIFGTKPKVAPFIPTDLSVEAGKATSANLANYPAISELLDKIVPGFSGLEAQGLSNAASELQGRIPDDVKAEIFRDTAQQAEQGGFAGTPMKGALTARDLGQTSLGLQQAGQNSAQSWASIAEGLTQPYLITTGDETAVAQANAAGQQATAQAQNNIAAAPNPAAAGLFNFDTAQNQSQNNELMGLALLLSKQNTTGSNSGFSNLFGSNSSTSSTGGWNIDANGNIVNGPIFNSGGAYG